MPADPIAAIISALTDPTTGLFQPIAGSGPAQPGPLYNEIQPIVTAIFSATPDLTTVSQQINAALTEAAGAVAKISTAVGGLGNLANVSAAMTALQNALSLAQSLAPSGAAVVLSSGSALFQTIENQLSSVSGGSAQAATELTQLSALLTGLAELFPK